MAYPISADVLNLFLAQYRQVIRISVSGQTETIELSETDITQNGFSLSRYTVSGSTIELGSAISSEVNIVLNNKDGRFNTFIFEGAELFVEVGIKKWDARKWENAVMHYVPLGYFTVDNSPRKSHAITIAALDRMMLFAKTVNRDILHFPMTVGHLLGTICDECGVVLATNISALPNINYSIPICPEDENLTYRTLLQWIAMMTGTCAYIDWEGKLRLEWYKTQPVKRLIPSERYVPSDLSENTVTITGVELITDEENFICGEEGYTLVIENNSLIQSDFDTILRNIYLAVGNLTYRPYSCNTKPLPHLFPMDKIEWEDMEGNVVGTIITNYSFSLNCSTALEAKGETETDASYAASDPMTAREKTIINKMRKDVSKEITTRERAVLALNEAIANSLGLYETRVTVENGSTVFYFHDRPTLQESTAIYTRNAGGYAWTVGENCWNNGNPVWQYGYTKEGNAVYNAISAFKISTDLLDAHAITSEKIAVGAIGGFTIDSEHIGHGMTSYNDSEHDGVYLSPTGIGLGKGKFYVTPQGFLHAESGEFTGDIKGGTININDNFTVDENGNVSLKGNVTWGTGASPTQVLYARTSIAKPSNDSNWSDFPSTSSTAWHKTYNSTYDYFASYTYDGGKTWGNPVKIRGSDGVNGTNGTDGSNGSTIQIAYLYYRKTNSTPPSTPSYSGGTVPSGWSLIPQGVTSYYLYEFVSQSTIVNGSYMGWTTPVCWAKYGVNGSDASVNYTNVFNALTNNGTNRGCFTAQNGQLYINADYIQSGEIHSNITFTGRLVAEDADISGNISASSGRIGGWYIGINDGYLRTANGTYGNYQWTTTGTDLRSAYGYAFVALTPQGIRYILKAGSNYDNSATIVETSSFLNIGGGSIIPGDGDFGQV